MNYLTIGGLAIASLLLIGFGLNHITRNINLAAAKIQVVEVEPGVKCAKMASADGVAISCWRYE
jgi:hypothetical protein